MLKTKLIHTRVAFLAAILGWIVLLCPPLAFSSDELTTPKEYLLKAVCLYNFSQFTHWPGSKSLEGHDTVLLGIVGDSPFGEAIRELQTSLTNNNKRNISVTYYGSYHDGMNLAKNHILFISSSEQKNMKKIIKDLDNAPILTISDADGFLEAGGMISLVLMNNTVRWGINRAPLERSGISVRAKLLQLAIKVIGNLNQSDLFHNPFNEETPWQVSRTFFINICSTARNYSSRLLDSKFS